jgi:hypothetical protein
VVSGRFAPVMKVFVQKKKKKIEPCRAGTHCKGDLMLGMVFYGVKIMS